MKSDAGFTRAVYLPPVEIESQRPAFREFRESKAAETPIMRRRMLLLVGLVVSLSVTYTQSPAWTVLFQDDFESGTAENWSLFLWQGQDAGWIAAQDGANRVFSGRGHSTAVLIGPKWFDFRFALRVKLVRGALFANFRSGSCTRYYISFEPGAVSLNRTLPCGTHTALVSVSETHDLGRWYTLEILGVGAHLDVFIDGERKIAFDDTTPVLSGGVGLEANPDSEILVDDVKITGPPPAEAPGGAAWVKTGGPLGGLGYDVRMRPDNPQAMFVTDIYSGVNVSDDGGGSWSSSNRGILTRNGSTGDAVPIFSLTIDQNNPTVVWAGTQSVRGIFKSTDGGRSWAQKDKGIQGTIGVTFRGFTIQAGNSQIVYAAGEIDNVGWADASKICFDGFAMSKGVVYKSVDGGESWNAIWSGDSLARYVWIDPRNANVLFVSTGIFDRAPANCNPDGSFYGGAYIIKSVDGGRTWRTLNEANGLTTSRFGTLFMHPQNPDILLAGGGGPHVFRADGTQIYTDGGAFLTTDGGERWTKTLATGTENITSVEFASSDPRIAYAAGEGAFYRSVDGGNTWTRMAGPVYGPPGIRPGVPIDLQVDPRNPNRVFANYYKGGNFLTEDGGRTWTVASRGYTGAQIHRVSVSADDPYHVFAVGRSGIFGSTDGGTNWVGLNNLTAEDNVFGESGSLAMDPAHPNHLLYSAENEGLIMASADGGQNWRRVFHHPQISLTSGTYRTGQGFRAMAFAPSNPNVVYAGLSHNIRSIDEGWRDAAFGIVRSTDGGETWTDAFDANIANLNINMLAVHPRNENVIYAATAGGGIFHSLDGGRSWAAINSGLRILDVRALAIDPWDPRTIYAGIEKGGIYKTTDSGGAWTSFSTGVDPTASIRDIVVDASVPQVVYAADFSSGVYRTEDGGNLWVQINKGLTTRAVKGLGISADGSVLYAATEGEGVFRLVLRMRL